MTTTTTTLETIKRIAALRHVATKPKDHLPTAGIHLTDYAGTYWQATATNMIFAAQWRDLPVEGALPLDFIADASDLTAAAVAFNARKPDDADADADIAITITQVDEGLRLDLVDELIGKPRLFEHDASPASYVVRCWSEAVYPDVNRLLLMAEDQRGSSAPFSINATQITRLAKTTLLAGDPVLTLHTAAPRRPLLILARDLPGWRGLIGPIVTGDDREATL